MQSNSSRAWVMPPGWGSSIHIYRYILNRTNKLLPKGISMHRKSCDFFPSDFHKNKGLISPAGKFCKITLQSASTKPANTTQTQTSPSLLCSKGPRWDRRPVTPRRARLFSRFGEWTDVLLGWWRQALPHTFSHDVLTNILSQLFRGDQQLMHAKAGARIITHGSHTVPNSCQSAKFLSGSERHGVHFVCPWLCSLRIILERLKLITKWSLWMNRQEKIKQTLRIYASKYWTGKNGFYIWECIWGLKGNYPEALE